MQFAARHQPNLDIPRFVILAESRKDEQEISLGHLGGQILDEELETWRPWVPVLKARETSNLWKWAIKKVVS